MLPCLPWVSRRGLYVPRAARSRSSCLPDKIRPPLYATTGPNRPVVTAVPLSPGKQYGGRIDMMLDCAHFVLNSNSLQLIPAYSSQSSRLAQILAAVGLSESE